MISMRSVMCLVPIVLLSGCGGGAGSGGVSDATAKETAPWAVLDLGTHRVEYLQREPGVGSSQAMVFRRLSVANAVVFVAVVEVTQGQWQRLSTSRPWERVDPTICSAPADVNRPAYNLDLMSVRAACAGFPVIGAARLDVPSDAEWLAACGVERGWWWGGQALQRQASVRETVVTVERLQAGGGVDAGGPPLVGGTTANALGFRDVLGSVWEWTREGTQVRGGSWYDPVRMCRAEVVAGASDGVEADIELALVGARLVLRP